MMEGYQDLWRQLRTDKIARPHRQRTMAQGAEQSQEQRVPTIQMMVEWAMVKEMKQQEARRVERLAEQPDAQLVAALWVGSSEAVTEAEAGAILAEVPVEPVVAPPVEQQVEQQAAHQEEHPTAKLAGQAAKRPP